MRFALRKYHQKRLLFTATIAKTSLYNDNGILRDTVLLINLRSVQNGEILADHVWVRSFPPLKNFKLHDTIKFYATVKAYIKDNRYNTVDYSLASLSNIGLI